MITLPPVPLTACVSLFLLATNIMLEDGQIRLGMFVYALKHGSKHKYGSRLDDLRQDFADLTDEQLRTVYEIILGELDRFFPDMTCGIEGWRFEFGYVVSDDSSAQNRLHDRSTQRGLDLKNGRHPDAKTSTRGTLLPGTTWYRNRKSSQSRDQLPIAA